MFRSRVSHRKFPLPTRAIGTAALALCMINAAPLTAAENPAQDFPGLERLMNVEQFRKTGLTKLSDSELEALNQWLLTYTAGDAHILQGTNAAVREAEKNIEMTSRISGDFVGWTGKTLFSLKNGQVWQQRLAGRYRYVGPANPEARISKNALGFYKMTLVESGVSIGVKPVR